VRPAYFWTSSSALLLLEINDRTACTEILRPFALNVSKKISAIASLFSGGFYDILFKIPLVVQ
jgi:hypothetical protein